MPNKPDMPPGRSLPIITLLAIFQELLFFLLV